MPRKKKQIGTVICEVIRKEDKPDKVFAGIIDVSTEKLAKALEKTGDPKALTLAEMLRRGKIMIKKVSVEVKKNDK